MAQTTEQSRSRAKGSTSKKSGNRAGLPVGSSVPGPPRRRRPALTERDVMRE